MPLTSTSRTHRHLCMLTTAPPHIKQNTNNLRCRFQNKRPIPLANHSFFFFFHSAPIHAVAGFVTCSTADKAQASASLGLAVWMEPILGLDHNRDDLIDAFTKFLVVDVHIQCFRAAYVRIFFQERFHIEEYPPRLDIKSKNSSEPLHMKQAKLLVHP